MGAAEIESATPAPPPWPVHVGRYRIRVDEVRQRRIVRLFCEPVEGRASRSGGSAEPGSHEQG
jgi:hypothetical protein